MGAYDNHPDHKTNPFESTAAPSPSHAAADHSSHAPAGYSGPSRGAVPGAYSPAVDTLLDPRETYLANKAGMDAKWNGSDMLARALARHRGEKVEEGAIKPELGAPKQTRPLASTDQVMAQVHAESAKPPAAAPTPPPAAPHSGPTERDVYTANAGAADERASKDVWLQRALERYGKKK